MEVIEVLIKPGDVVDAEDSLITLESEKASMDVPSPKTGTIKELKIKVGDKVGEGDLIAILEVVEEATAARTTSEPIESGVASQQKKLCNKKLQHL